MMTLRDNFTLALTKLRTRPVRLIVTLVISGLLFSVLIFMSLVVRGTLGSLTSFTKEGYLNRFIVSLYTVDGYEISSKPLQDPVVITRANTLWAQTKSAKAAEAKRLGLAYDPAQESPLLVPDAKDQNGTDIKMLDATNPAARQAVIEHQAGTDHLASVKQLAKDYRATAVYTGYTFTPQFGAEEYQLSPIVDGKEQEQKASLTASPDPISSFSSTFFSYSAKMMGPLLFAGASLDAKPGEPIPIVAPFDAAEKLTGLAAPSAKASVEDRRNHIAAVRSKAKNLEFSVCYRNDAALELSSNARAQIEEMKARKNEPGYVAPAAQYSLPTQACALPAITKDTRSAAEKRLAAQEAEFSAKFGKGAPVASKISFRIVGLSPATPSARSSFSFEGLLASFLSFGSLNGWIAPVEAVNTNPYLAAVQNDKFIAATAPPNVFIELPDRQAQKRLVSERSCSSDPGQCKAEQAWYITPIANPLATIYDVSGGFNTFLTIVLGIIAGISALIMMGTIGKVIADSRRETSVFRALGARRLQIIQLYGLYAASLGFLTFGVAATLGMLVGAVLDAQVAPNLSIQAVTMFNASDLNRQFHVVGLHITDLLAIAGLSLLTALVSAILPLSIALRRDPVKDMRDET